MTVPIVSVTDVVLLAVGTTIMVTAALRLASMVRHRHRHQVQ